MTRASRQRGAATLGITLLLLFIVMLVAGVASRNLIFEQRASANQWRSTQAFEAAEAGLDWAQAMLASDAAIGPDCQPDAAPGNTAFRERLVAYDADSRAFTPRTWNDGGHAVPLQAACARLDDGWACSCPREGHPVLDAPPSTGAHPSFAIRFIAADRSGHLQLLASGCDRLAPDCVPGMGGGASGGSTARAQVTLGLLPALAARPTAALTARGDVDAGGALALSNTDPRAGGVTAHAGGAISLAGATLETVPGVPVEASLVERDDALAALEADRVTSRLFGVDAARWQRLPGLQTLTCPADCSAALEAALAAGHRRIRVTNELRLSGPAGFGSAARPILLVVEAPMQMSGGVQIHGVVVNLAALWDTTATHDARIDGAVIAAGNVVGDGTPAIAYDPDAIARLNAEAGVFVRLAGSWRDF